MTHDDNSKKESAPQPEAVGNELHDTSSPQEDAQSGGGDPKPASIMSKVFKRGLKSPYNGKLYPYEREDTVLCETTCSIFKADFGRCCCIFRVYNFEYNFLFDLGNSLVTKEMLGTYSQEAVKYAQKNAGFTCFKDPGEPRGHMILISSNVSPDAIDYCRESYKHMLEHSVPDDSSEGIELQPIVIDTKTRKIWKENPSGWKFAELVKSGYGWGVEPKSQYECWKICWEEVS